MSRPRFDPSGALQTLVRHGVQFVLVGGLAGAVHGSTTVTNDVDICYSREDDNLERLAAALRELNARLRGVDEDIPFTVDARALKIDDHFTFTTDAGGLDLLGSPAGIPSFESGRSPYDNLAAGAMQIQLHDAAVKVASLDDLIAMKRAAGRPKDRIELEVLAALRELTQQTRNNADPGSDARPNS